ncbi:hypothetical protein [Streptomyces sp. NPDC051994]|uniref:hypothetical protein n=1 Tax=unclassified Streptomyces TaxID=2593676 RepID=UPI0034445CCE
MTRDDWILAIFAFTPLALFAIGLTIDMVTHNGGSATTACHGCSHAYNVHNGPDTKCLVEACGCWSYEDPPEEDPVPLGCGG